MSINKSGRIVCDWCGCYIGFKDLYEGKAYHIQDNPEWDTYLSACSIHSINFEDKRDYDSYLNNKYREVGDEILR